MGGRLEGRFECGRSIYLLVWSRMGLQCEAQITPYTVQYVPGAGEGQRSSPYAMHRVARTKAPSHDAMTGGEIHGTVTTVYRA